MLAELFLENEVLAIVREEIGVEKFLVKVILYFVWYLIEDIEVLDVAQGLVLVMLPFEFEV